MTKRHLKVTGDLGRVVFVVCEAHSSTTPRHWLINLEIGIRSTQYAVNRSKCPALRRRLQFDWSRLPYEVCPLTATSYLPWLN